MGIFPEREKDGEKHLLQKAEEGKLKALYLVGETSPITPKALENLQLLIVQDLFMTEIAKMAHLVLPACSFVEKGGTFTNLERRVQRLHPLRPPRDQSKSDFDIFLQILRLLETHVTGETPESIFKDICWNIPHYQGVHDGRQWPNGSPYLYSDGFPIGKAKLIPVETEISLSNPEGNSFQLIQRPSLFESGLLSSKSNALKKVSEKPYLEMNHEDAKLLKIEDGEVIQVLASGGRSLKTIVKYSPRLVSGVTTLPYPCPLLDEGGVVSVRVERLIGGRES
jgi:predicted molibdopterin-dependent oxidoreductase YjgC